MGRVTVQNWFVCVSQFFSYQTYIISGEEYSLQDIENGVLRANRKGVGKSYLSLSVADSIPVQVMKGSKVSLDKQYINVKFFYVTKCFLCFKYFLFILGMFSLPFGKSDPRLKVALQTPEPLIHFALVCGAKSCPPIKTYSADVSFANSSLYMTKADRGGGGHVPPPPLASLIIYSFLYNFVI